LFYLVLVGPSIPYESFDSGVEALAAAIAAVTKYGGAKAGYRTLLDALIPALSSLEEVLTIAVHLLC
jgi:dihydroxyacetone kinase